MGSENSKKKRKEGNQSSGSDIGERSKGLMQPNLQLPEHKVLYGTESAGEEQINVLEGGQRNHPQELVSKYIQMDQSVTMLEESNRQFLSTLNKLENKYHQHLREDVPAEKELQGTNTEVGIAEDHNLMDIAGRDTVKDIAGSKIDSCCGKNTKTEIVETEIQKLITSVESFNKKINELLQNFRDEKNDTTMLAFVGEFEQGQLKAIRTEVSQIYDDVTVFLMSQSSQVGKVADETKLDHTVSVYNLPGFAPKYQLNKSHTKFSRTLKRRNTLRCHDNRIALHYNMETVEGCVTDFDNKDKKDKEENLGVGGNSSSSAGRKSVDQREGKRGTGDRNLERGSKGPAKKSSVWRREQVMDDVSHSVSKPTVKMESIDTSDSQANNDHEKTYKNCFLESIPLALVDVNKIRAQGYHIEENQEIVIVDEAYWTQRLQEAVSNGSDLKSCRGTGFDTILLVDISASVGKEKWVQTITFLHNFLDGIESSQDYLSGAFEHISLVVFGHETKVVQHLTCDYVSLRKHIDCLSPNGPSPLVAGVAMCNAALEAAGHIYSCQKVTVYPRILLITDGCPTDTFRIAGPDIASDDEQLQEKKRVLKMFKKLREEQNIRVIPIPIGDYDKDFLQEIASATNGKVVSPVNWRKLANYQKQVDICCKLAMKKIDPLLYILYRAHVEEVENASNADMEEADELLHEHRVRVREVAQEEDLEDEFIECDPNMPPLGTRVVRGLNWCWDIQDSNGIGTVIGHQPRGLLGWITVQWDQKHQSGIDQYNYRYGADGAYDLLPVDEPRLLQLEEKIAVGCIVKRGKDWKEENRERGPGNVGVVLKVYKKGLVKVRWENGMKDNYRFGCDQKYDVELCNPFEVRRFFEGGGNENTLTEMQGTKSMESKDRQTPQNSPVANTLSSSFLQSPSSRDKNSTSTPNVHKSNVHTSENPHSALSGKCTPSLGKNPVPKKKIVPQLFNRQDLEMLTEKSSERASQRVTGNSRTSGAIQKSNDPSQFVQKGEKMTSHSVVWQWYDSSGHWISYEQEICQQLENRFQKNPGSSVTINHQNQIYRVVFSRMQQLNTTTKEWIDVQRLS